MIPVPAVFAHFDNLPQSSSPLRDLSFLLFWLLRFNNSNRQCWTNTHRSFMAPSCWCLHCASANWQQKSHYRIPSPIPESSHGTLVTAERCNTHSEQHFNTAAVVKKMLNKKTFCQDAKTKMPLLMLSGLPGQNTIHTHTHTQRPILYDICLSNAYILNKL